MKLSLVGLLLLPSCGCHAFMVPRASRVGGNTVHGQSSIAADVPAVNGKGGVENVAWDCDDEANCVQVDACDENECRTSLDVRIHGTWYDLSGTYAKFSSIHFVLSDSQSFDFLIL